MSIDGLHLIDPKCYAERGYPHAEWRKLREADALEFFEPPA